ncbi:RagB/SusD family nutrient uptake outer membrane protein [Sphingobacterium sp. SGG-5]|uniref:RagB/SusD family nutrient uptake outer membrane protein n=1 Tax=Sphingobacterium sp. SGG-5 TaxID=2710881 RepID=UPI0013EA4D95|nr:RagB/SusD family nutrient uptake outer membrane protein [Sphingobacterium sp. SGG-5]NGM61775.1 RagB/SusD family nutrient uptake outer membrane protein [Sphingobacterium sp. SGG-5]
MKTINVIFYLFIVFSMTGCKKYLEINPDNRVRLSTVEDFQAVITGAYPQAYHMFTELYTDNVRFYDYPDYNQANITSWLKPLYLWSDNYITNNAITPEAAWRKYYNDIYEANIVLENIEQASGDDGLRLSVMGEAYMNRAYCHFMLVNIFAKHYNKNTAGTDLGVPYMLETEKQSGREYARDNIQYVYDRIEEDAFKALELINEAYMSVPKFHWSKASIHAFLTRFYLFQGDWEKSLYHAEEVFKINSSIRDLFTDFDTYFVPGDYTTFARRYFETHNPNILLVNYTLEWNSYFRGSLYANEFRNTFHADDVRGRIYTRWNNQTPNYMARKFRGSLPSDGQSYSDVGLFVVEEVMYNAAEAAVRKDDPDFEYALEKLNRILERRWRPYVPLKLEDYQTVDLMLDKIIDEKNKELCYEGYRWFDVKRLEIPITHWDGTKEIYLPVNDPRRLVQIPFAELDANPLLEPNPR